MFGEFRSAARGLLRWRGGVVVAALTLAIGIGSTTGLYALVRVLVAEMPGVPDLDRVARIYAASPSLGVERSHVTLAEFDGIVSRAASFASIGGYMEGDAMIGTGAGAAPTVAGYASPGFFAAMAVPPAAGRTFTPDDLRPSRPVALLSHGAWKRLFPDGRFANTTVTVDGVERAVIGVMPAEFRYPFVGIGADVWLPLGRPGPDMPAIVNIYGRLRDGAGWPAAAAELSALARGREPWTWRAISIRDDARYRDAGVYAGAFGPALLVLLIACVNVACMLLARGIERDRELSVRRALGATRARVVRLLLTENLVLAAVSGAIGVGLAIAILRVIANALAAEQPELAARLAADLRLLPVALASTAAAVLIFGTVPALRLSRRDVAASLKGVPQAHRIQIAGYGARDAVVFAEVGCAVGLIVWTAMLYTLFAQVTGIRFTFPADRVIAMKVPAATVSAVAERAAAIPGVASASIAAGMLAGERVQARVDLSPAIALSRVPVGDRFFETLGVPVVRGRAFDAAELRGHAPVAVLSESAARQLAGGRDAVGLPVRFEGRQETLTVIGICRDAVDYGALPRAGTFAPADIYVPYEPPVVAPNAIVLARMAIDPRAALGAVAAAAQTPPGAPPVRPVILSDEANTRAGAGTMLAVKLLLAFSVLTLLLAASGVFAVISQSVAQRTREFGIRLAIGATPRRVLGMVLAREGKLIGLGIATGLVFTMALTRALFVELTRLNAILPSMWVGALLLSGGVAAVAVMFATYRIVRLEPATVLRRT
jgi:predicted permease